MIELLNRLDSELFIALHTMFRSNYIDNVMWFLSARWTWIPMYAALFYWLVIKLGLRRALVWTVAITLTIVCADQLCATIIRPAVGRMRPSNPDSPITGMVSVVRDYRGGAYGFPSCHAANTFALCVIASLILRNRIVVIWLAVWALLNCLSRIYLGVHYPGDLIVGAIVGALSGSLWYPAGNYMTSGIAIRPMPLSVPLSKWLDRYNPIVVTGVATVFAVFILSLICL